MKLFLTVVLLFAASFSFAQSFVDDVVSEGEGPIGSSETFTVITGFEEAAVQISVVAQCSSNDGSSFALAYFNTGPSVYAEAPYGAYYTGTIYWDEKWDTVYVQPWSSVDFYPSILASADPGEYAVASIGATW